MIVIPHTPLNTQTIHYSVWSRAKKGRESWPWGVVITTTQQLNNHHIFTKHHPHVVWQCYKSVQSKKVGLRKWVGILWVVVAFHPSWKKRRQSFFSSQGSQPLKEWNYVVGPWGGLKRVPFSVGPHSVVVHATIGDCNPTKPKGTCILPTTQASYYFWVLVSMSVSSREVACWQKKFLLFVFKQES
jgi:hypothetical protein